jgi:hypothetical protein
VAGIVRIIGENATALARQGGRIMSRGRTTSHDGAFLVYLSGSLAVVGFALLVLWAGLTWMD